MDRLFFNGQISENRYTGHSNLGKGLEPDVLIITPTDKHLVRLARKISIKVYHEFVMHLGLPMEDSERAGYKHRAGEIFSKEFDALIKLKRIGKDPSFKELRKAVKKINEDNEDAHHILCQIFREDTQILEIDNLKLLDILEDKILQDLSKIIGNCAEHLGIELEVDINEIKASLFQHSKNMFGQNFDILMKWKYGCTSPTRGRELTVNKTKIPCISRSQYPTVTKPKDPHVSKSKHPTVSKAKILKASKNIRSLMHALWIVDRRGCDFLTDKYNIKY